ncbi:ribonuclease HI [Synechococcus sp. RSCCF101]|uniref:ribonuclease H family protein n=1 Tax=Synechococcus sp. RSCCF101 TaxID=2511069 RepID=UPI0012476913|nr:ribonuclease H [Synechococcus sp. RSCCF101]QEY32803.1 ribonuclease HI [Synechococcus sp. RSCCF101]
MAKQAQQQPRVVAAASDGACSGNPGPGGWGALLRFEDGTERELGGAAERTTNNRMELEATLRLYEALADLPRHPDLAIRTDSKYVIDGLTRWLPNWKRKGWVTAARKPVLNRDLWEALDAARLADVPLRYVKGHSGDPDNDRVDAIAVAFSQGRSPRLANGPSAPAAPEPSVQPQADPAPPALVALLGRLELADRLARGGYSLTTAELAQLVEQPMRQLEQRSGPWRWRDWEVHPQDGSGWRLERCASGSDGRA